jgi:GntR family transcriptional repressor for pyruvate dehydrogenase complex
MVLEPQAAAWAAERATEGQVDELRGLTAAGHGAAGDLERFAALDAELHTAVANAAGNAVAAHVLTSLRALATRSRRLALRTQQARARTADDHGRIVEAIAGHAPDDARSAMAGHLHALRDGSARLARRGERHER